MPAWLLRGVGVGPGEQEDPIGVLTERRPRLLTVDDIVSPSRTAVVRSDARSEPASGSEKP